MVNFLQALAQLLVQRIIQKISYLMIDNSSIVLKDIDGNVIDEVNVKN